jgi:hypothetical protein
MTDFVDSTVFEVNMPYVVHETIEGETIAMNLRDGNYYSFDGIGPAIWGLIAQTISIRDLLKTLSEITSQPIDQISEIACEFVHELASNGLIRTCPNSDTSAGIDPETLNRFKELYAGTSVRKPVFHRYSDMRDILLLDPIHDVDAIGWPEPKQR